MANVFRAAWSSCIQFVCLTGICQDRRAARRRDPAESGVFVWPGTLSLGIKILLGVALVSNISIGAIFYVKNAAQQEIEAASNDLLFMHEQLGQQQRQAISRLQERFLSMGDFFRIDQTQHILRELSETHSISRQETLSGREQYKHLYTRQERRDLASGKFIIQSGEQEVVVSHSFSFDEGRPEQVRRLFLSSSEPERVAKQVSEIIARFQSADSTPSMLQQKQKELQELLTDEALLAEQTRTEIVRQQDHLQAAQEQLVRVRANNNRFSMIVTLAASLANLVVLFVLTRIVVEKPLFRLSNTIEQIHRGESPEVPYALRQDQIGILAGAIEMLKKTLSSLHEETQRREAGFAVEKRKKARHDAMVNEMLHESSSVIANVGAMTNELVDLAGYQNQSAHGTTEHASHLTAIAEETARNTREIAESTVNFQRAVNTINGKLGQQGEIIRSINAGAEQSTIDLAGLDQAASDIHDVIEVVRGVAEQTKLLALNATIEAARVGTAGKGFSVVAAEIKELSRETEKATVRIMEQVERISSAAEVTSANLVTIQQQVEHLSTISFALSDEASQQKRLSEEIAHHSKKTMQYTEDVSSNATRVAAAASTTLHSAERVESRAEEIAREMTGLREFITGRLHLLRAEEASEDTCSASAEAGGSI